MIFLKQHKNFGLKFRPDGKSYYFEHKKILQKTLMY